MLDTMGKMTERVINNMLIVESGNEMSSTSIGFDAPIPRWMQYERWWGTEDAILVSIGTRYLMSVAGN